ncbi:MAG: hypothetical protein NTX03_12645 [Bacteroidetes bacterium]|nr:hypothetical protein [Bacteroidota bacterium]
MKTALFQSLKDTFVNAATQNNKTTAELCIVELSSGNFPKAVTLSEDIIKGDINDSIGWAAKALSQAHLFDYGSNLFFLKSSITSLGEFKKKTNLSAKEINTIEAVFVTTILDRTVALVTERLNEVIALRQQAIQEKQKATAAAVGTLVSAYVGSQSNSNIGKVIGFGGAVAGVAATAQFNTNAEELNNASKGVFGVAIGNISLTIGGAMSLKRNLNTLDPYVREEAISTLNNWTTTLAFLYQQVGENILSYFEGYKKGAKYFDAVKNLMNVPEITQFLYLSKMLGVEQSIPEFNKLETQIIEISNADLSLIKREQFKNAAIIFISAVGIDLIITFVFNSPMGGILGMIGGVVLLSIILSTKGKAGELARSIVSFIAALKKFKLTSDKIIIENMSSEDKTFNTEISQPNQQNNSGNSASTEWEEMR